MMQHSPNSFKTFNLKYRSIHIPVNFLLVERTYNLYFMNENIFLYIQYKHQQIHVFVHKVSTFSFQYSHSHIVVSLTHNYPNLIWLLRKKSILLDETSPFVYKQRTWDDVLSVAVRNFTWEDVNEKSFFGTSLLFAIKRDK